MKNHYLYYPGCSMESSAKAYSESLMAILEPLEIDLEEIDDWNCCGATEYVGISLTPAYALISRNLALASQHEHGGSPVQRLLPQPG
jgi:heterodisulfide reductase subunit B